MCPALVRSVVLTLALAVPAVGDIRQDVTASIRTGDLAAVRAALAADDPLAQRKAFAAFETAHPDAGEASAALLADTPDDPRPQTARGWHLLATGWALRGTGTINTVHPEAKARMDQLHKEAHTLSRQAIRAAPTRVAASDLFILSARATGNRRAIPEEFERIMAVAPTRHSLILAVGGMVPVRGGPPGWGAQACTTYARLIEDVPGYTEAICALNIIFAADHAWKGRVAAFERRPAFDHPVLDPARRLNALHGIVHDRAKLVARLRALPDRAPDRQVAEKLDALLDNVPPGEVGLATRAALKTEVPRLRDEVDFNPGNSRLVQQFVDALFLEAQATGEPVRRDEMDRAFAALFAPAPYDPDTWARHGYLMDRTINTPP